MTSVAWMFLAAHPPPFPPAYSKAEREQRACSTSKWTKNGAFFQMLHPSAWSHLFKDEWLFVFTPAPQGNSRTRQFLVVSPPRLWTCKWGQIYRSLHLREDGYLISARKKQKSKAHKNANDHISPKCPSSGQSFFLITPCGILLPLSA